uniref:Putative molecular chaperone prefoldin subunit 1 n=1 Tax=Lutzomyia longipalpis TaxID=7200 RepID=A0A1B0CSN2_LUTLO
MAAAVAQSPADLELRKAFAEMQMNKIESTKKLRSKQRLIITEHEVSNLPPETKVYASIGRMFALSSAPEMTSELKAKQTKVDSMISQCDTNKNYVLKNLKEQEDNLRELVQQKKRDADAAK